MTIRNQILELIVLLNTEVWDIPEDYARAGGLMCLAHRIPATQENIDKLMTEGWRDCEKADGTTFKYWTNSIENVLGDNGQVLVPQLIEDAKAGIVRPDTKFEVGFGSKNWLEHWGIVFPVEPIDPLQ